MGRPTSGAVSGTAGGGEELKRGDAGGNTLPSVQIGEPALASGIARTRRERLPFPGSSAAPARTGICVRPAGRIGTTMGRSPNTMPKAFGQDPAGTSVNRARTAAGSSAARSPRRIPGSISERSGFGGLQQHRRPGAVQKLRRLDPRGAPASGQAASISSPRTRRRTGSGTHLIAGLEITLGTHADEAVPWARRFVDALSHDSAPDWRRTIPVPTFVASRVRGDGSDCGSRRRARVGHARGTRPAVRPSAEHAGYSSETCIGSEGGNAYRDGGTECRPRLLCRWTIARGHAAAVFWNRMVERRGGTMRVSVGRIRRRNAR